MAPLAVLRHRWSGSRGPHAHERDPIGSDSSRLLADGLPRDRKNVDRPDFRESDSLPEREMGWTVAPELQRVLKLPRDRRRELRRRHRNRRRFE